MSMMDLQIQLPQILVRPPPRSDDHDIHCDRLLSVIPPENSVSYNHDDDRDELCQTPKSADHRIPQLRSPPPAPRKKRPPLACKRNLMMKKRSELQFFEIVNRDELDEFFQSGFDQFASKRNKCLFT